jgi:hypothetical protein
MKIAVLMFYNDAIKEYGDINYKINKAYCEKHGLELIVSNKRLYPTRHPAWERIPLLLKYLKMTPASPNYDYLLWIDADAFFYLDSNSIVDIINSNSRANFIFSRDKDNKTVNSGFFIVKNNDYSILFLNKWGFNLKLYQMNSHPEWWDQGVLNDMIHQDILNISKNSICLDYGILQHFRKEELTTLPKPFVYHLAGRNHSDRVAASKQYLMQQSL